MIQYHPTTLAGKGFLITEGARGEGAHLLNANGERFMEKYAPNKMELASRDVVSRAEQTEINEGRGFPDGTVALDITVVPKKRIHEALREIVLVGRDFAGVDITREPIHIKPGNHYTMGGVKTDVDGPHRHPRPLRRRRGRLRLGPRRQPARRQLAARHADLRPPLRRRRRRPRQADRGLAALAQRCSRTRRRRSPTISAARRAPAAASPRSSSSWATTMDEQRRRLPRRGRASRRRWRPCAASRRRPRPPTSTTSGTRLQPGPARGDRARLHARQRRVHLRRRARAQGEPRRPVPHRLPGAQRRGVAQAHRPRSRATTGRRSPTQR